MGNLKLGGGGVAPSTQYSVLGTQYTILSIAVAMLSGCVQSVHVPDKAAAKATNAAAVQLTPGDAKALEALIATHKGEVVLVDYWATWCGPCVENFPHTVELAKKYRQQGLTTIAVSFDLLDDEPKVREFLAKQGADFENLISKHDSIGQKAWEDFDIGPLPEYRLYGRQGKLNQKWEANAQPDELEKKIEELLAEKP
jgi:thiol-disulfide isomerase/thioredoxin